MALIRYVRAPAASAGVSWPQALRGVRAWLARRCVWLRRCWRGWSTSPPLDWVKAGRPIYVYLPRGQHTHR
jgi:hypothetical protein